MRQLILAGLVTVFLAPVALAQPATPNTGAGNPEIQATGPDLTRASRVLRQDVYNPNGQAIGSIDELIIDPHSGQIQQVVIGVGGVLGLGKKLVAVPFSELTLKPVAASTVPPMGAVGTGTVPPAATPPAQTGAIPGGSAAPTRIQDRFVINMTQDQLKAAPAYHYPERH